jgi:hypothetical protein
MTCSGPVEIYIKSLPNTGLQLCPYTHLLYIFLFCLLIISRLWDRTRHIFQMCSSLHYTVLRHRLGYSTTADKSLRLRNQSHCMCCTAWIKNCFPMHCVKYTPHGNPLTPNLYIFKRSIFSVMFQFLYYFSYAGIIIKFDSTHVHDKYKI